MNDTRVTDFGPTEIELLDGKKYKIRSLSFAEKLEYLELVDKIKVQTQENPNLIKDYILLQLDVAHLILSKMNPELTKEQIKTSVNGEILKRILEIAFYDPFSVFQVK